MVGAYAITIHVDLMRGGDAIDVAGQVDLAQVPSATRRSFHIIELARAHALRSEDVAVVHLLAKAHKASPDTARYNPCTRSTVEQLATSGPALVRDDARALAEAIGVMTV
ncbi:hypothetical protein ACFPZ0_03805 [Streptomonospora nanhaiensis]|uniref:Uncharacterized protein n=1 Tax=Streptomonospora nanhaiensis TaxID=1323731 RepID=A0A853BLU4_9ACTN|nr:hypothetical protein [Streptomonospora nanhaiensis]MBV2361985.1 hypothetical protein [Streptomonospora nanhaiensis]MBX9386782.1 hypothetical protein [Streptomonospora nanhaiensis]NYI96193.1 hypothetical protein [Streptomonospora nanhaiensis]